MYEVSLDDGDVSSGHSVLIGTDGSACDRAFIREFYDYVHRGEGVFNKFGVKGSCPHNSWYEGGRRLRNVRIGYPAVCWGFGGEHVWKEGNVARQGSCAVGMDMEVCRLDSIRSTMRIRGDHHHGSCLGQSRPGNQVPTSLPNNVRIVWLDVCNVRWCSVCGVAFQSFVWPRSAREAKSIMRTLFINHCSWADVLIVRGRCFCSRRSCHASNRVLEKLLWHWAKIRRPYVDYKEGSADTGGGLVPGWLEGSHWYDRVGQSNLVGGECQDLFGQYD